jgi:hypothetical protein
MPTLVSTGQITIVDNNDAKPLTAYITSNPGIQQIFSKDESTQSFLPDWFTANTNTGIQLSPRVFVGSTSGATEITAQLSNKRWTTVIGSGNIYNGSTTTQNTTDFVDSSYGALATPFTVLADGAVNANNYLRIKGNLKETVGAFTVFFEGDYTDTVTGLVTHIIAQITLNTVKTGTNAVFILTRGQFSIEEATGSTKNAVAVAADLVRAGGVIDTSGLSFKWFDTNGGTQISTSTANYTTKYTLTTTTGPAPPTAVAITGAGVPASGAGNANNTLSISETAVNDLAIFRVDITDADSKTYSAYFTVYDVSDPYEVKILSSAGDKLQNGVGSTNLTPDVFYGASEVTTLTGWSFTWYYYDRNGNRGGFIDTGKISTSGGAPVTANTTGTSATITYTGTSYAFVAGDVIKVVRANGLASFYEVASSTTNVVTIRTPSSNTWLSFTNFPAPSASSDFVGGKLYGCTAQGTRTTSAGASITVTGDDIDAKANIVCEATRP